MCHRCVPPLRCKSCHTCSLAWCLDLLLQSNLVESIAGLVEDKVLDGIADVRDESDRTGERAQLLMDDLSAMGVCMS